MYVPKTFAEDRLDVLHDFIRQSNFATLVSGSSGTGTPLVASHVPLLLDPAFGPFGTLRGHLARQNPQGEALASRAGEVLAIFHGPHAYVSPRWYVGPVNVPTWNYVAVHAYGTPRVLSMAELGPYLEALVAAHEPPAPDGWDLRSLPPEFIEKMKAQVVGFEIEITRLEGKWKLGQNKSREDRAGAVAGLRAGGDPAAVAVAELMERTFGPDAERSEPSRRT